jgi:hypothetical protein
MNKPVVDFGDQEAPKVLRIGGHLSRGFGSHADSGLRDVRSWVEETTDSEAHVL